MGDDRRGNRPHILCVGAINLDRKAAAKESVVFGTSNPVTMSESSGGVARNIADNLARLGCDVSMLSVIGDDQDGGYILSELGKVRIGAHSVRMLRGERTGTYIAVIDTNGEMTIALANMEINERVTPRLIDELWPEGHKPDLVVLDTNFPENCIAYVIERCRQESIPLYIDPVSTPKALKLPASLAGVDALLPNRDEAETISGIRIATPADCREACARIRARGARRVFITLGEQGVYASGPEGDALIPAVPVRVVDVTGAGDAFAAGLIYGIAQDLPPLEACRCGTAASALTLRTAQSVAPDLNAEQLHKLIKEHPHEIILDLHG